ncbi:MAG: tyrosine--tRNA ligase [Verrucomicrobiae bacterium]|nr:tyrosine--tRNA ligase [Verrucomicrobiae bacterium]
MSIDEQLDSLLCGIEEIHSEDELKKKLQEKRPLRIKFGVDPTSPDIHLGHTVPLLKLRQFQDLGHHAVLIIGDFTARIGDPTGRNTTRPELSQEIITQNAKTYEQQAFKILDHSKTEIVYNSQWFDTMNSSQIIHLLARKPVAQLLQRRDFKQRMEEGHNIQLHELTYPLLQGWDSVEVKSDVEIGGSDQLFNFLMGRDLQEQEKQCPQVVMTLPILEGTDGHEKMSKSLNNYIGVTESPEEMFGKTMSISDELMQKWQKILFIGDDFSDHPMEAKKQLGEKIVTRFHSADAATQARQNWEKQFSEKQVPENIPTYHLVANEPLWQLLKNAKLAPSSSEARRMIQQGAVSFEGEKISDEKTVLTQPGVIKYGKRHYLKLTK